MFFRDTQKQDKTKEVISKQVIEILKLADSALSDNSIKTIYGENKEKFYYGSDNAVKHRSHFMSATCNEQERTRWYLMQELERCLKNPDNTAIFQKLSEYVTFYASPERNKHYKFHSIVKIKEIKDEFDFQSYEDKDIQEILQQLAMLKILANTDFLCLEEIPDFLRDKGGETGEIIKQAFPLNSEEKNSYLNQFIKKQYPNNKFNYDKALNGSGKPRVVSNNKL